MIVICFHLSTSSKKMKINIFVVTWSRSSSNNMCWSVVKDDPGVRCVCCPGRAHASWHCYRTDLWSWSRATIAVFYTPYYILLLELDTNLHENHGEGPYTHFKFSVRNVRANLCLLLPRAKSYWACAVYWPGLVGELTADNCVSQ